MEIIQYKFSFLLDNKRWLMCFLVRDSKINEHELKSVMRLNSYLGK